jgi:hypothetical protein
MGLDGRIAARAVGEWVLALCALPPTEYGLPRIGDHALYNLALSRY